LKNQEVNTVNRSLERRILELEQERERTLPRGRVAFLYGRWWALDNRPQTRKLLQQLQQQPRDPANEFCDRLWGSSEKERAQNKTEVWARFEAELEAKGIFQQEKKNTPENGQEIEKKVEL
jgi:hypothetical protein